MNTVGKILVMLNFLFAIAVGALLVVDLATRTQWKEKYTQLKLEADALKNNRDQTVAMIPKLVDDFKRATADLEKAKQDVKDIEAKMMIAKADHEVEIANLNAKLVDKDITVTQSQELGKRLNQEVALLKTTIDDREKFIIGLEAKVKEIRAAAQNFEAMARTKQITNENLLQQIRDLTQLVAKYEAGVGPGGALTKAETSTPTFKINGKVDKVEGTLVQLSIGTDHGLQENHMLIAYRTSPEPLYLGMVRIVDARPHGSVARFIPPNTATRIQLKEGDLVTSSLK